MTVEARISALDPLSREARELRRFFFSGAAEADLDAAGSSSRPGRPHSPRRPRARGRRGRQLRPPRDLEPRRLGAAPACRRRERRTCCRTSCRTRKLITSPSSRTRCASSSPCSRARRSSTRPSAPAATRGCSRRTCGGRGKLVAIDRDPGREGVLRPFQGPRRRRRPVPPRRLRGRPLAARDERRQGGRDPARPRHLVDAGRPARARLLVRDRRAARHAHGPVLRGDAPRRSSTRGTSASSRRSSAATARSATPAPIARAIVRRRAERADLPHGRARRRDQARDPDAGAVRRGPSGQARLPGAPHRRQRRARRSSRPRCRPRSRCSGPAAGSR